jgi:Aminomethyltransferase folate-binding domain
MVDVFGDDVLEVPYYFLRRYELNGMQVLVSRTGYTSELGYEIYVLEASRDAERLWDAVLEAGGAHELAIIGPCHIRRIEGGMLAYGADMTLENNPYEVGMGYDWMVDLEQKAEFIGKQALARIKQEGPRRKLAGVEIAGDSLGAYNDGSMIDFFAVHHPASMSAKSRRPATRRDWRRTSATRWCRSSSPRSEPSSRSTSRATGARRSSSGCRSSIRRRRPPSSGSRPRTEQLDTDPAAGRAADVRGPGRAVSR